MMPARRKRAKMMAPKEGAPVKCPGHLKWVRGHACLVSGDIDHECFGRIEAHHVLTRAAGGGDDQVVPLCSRAHAEGHQIGWKTFEREYIVDLAHVAAELWKRSPHRIKHERKDK